MLQRRRRNNRKEKRKEKNSTTVWYLLVDKKCKTTAERQKSIFPLGITVFSFTARRGNNSLFPLTLWFWTASKAVEGTMETNGGRGTDRQTQTQTARQTDDHPVFLCVFSKLLVHGISYSASMGGKRLSDQIREKNLRRRKRKKSKRQTDLARSDIICLFFSFFLRSAWLSPQLSSDMT